MIKLVHELIEINLQILHKAENNFLNLTDFKDNNGKQLQEPKELAKIMQNKGLIIQNSDQDFVYEITAIGNEISKKGGWLEHLDAKKQIEILKIEHVKVTLQRNQQRIVNRYFFKLKSTFHNLTKNNLCQY
jgi:hypothetical protein